MLLDVGFGFVFESRTKLPKAENVVSTAVNGLHDYSNVPLLMQLLLINNAVVNSVPLPMPTGPCTVRT